MNKEYEIATSVWNTLLHECGEKIARETLEGYISDAIRNHMNDSEKMELAYAMHVILDTTDEVLASVSVGKLVEEFGKNTAIYEHAIIQLVGNCEFDRLRRLKKLCLCGYTAQGNLYTL